MTSANHFANNMAKIAIGAKVANYNTGSRIVWTVAARKRCETSFTITLRRGRRSRAVIVPVCFSGPDLASAGLRSVSGAMVQRGFFAEVEPA